MLPLYGYRGRRWRRRRRGWWTPRRRWWWARHRSRLSGWRGRTASDRRRDGKRRTNLSFSSSSSSSCLFLVVISFFDAASARVGCCRSLRSPQLLSGDRFINSITSHSFIHWRVPSPLVKKKNYFFKNSSVTSRVDSALTRTELGSLCAGFHFRLLRIKVRFNPALPNAPEKSKRNQTAPKKKQTTTDKKLTKNQQSLNQFGFFILLIRSKQLFALAAFPHLIFISPSVKNQIHFKDFTGLQRLADRSIFFKKQFLVLFKCWISVKFAHI